jgi:hypothetical protein
VGLAGSLLVLCCDVCSAEGSHTLLQLQAGEVRTALKHGTHTYGQKMVHV